MQNHFPKFLALCKVSLGASSAEHLTKETNVKAEFSCLEQKTGLFFGVNGDGSWN